MVFRGKTSQNWQIFTVRFNLINTKVRINVRYNFFKSFKCILVFSTKLFLISKIKEENLLFYFISNYSRTIKIIFNDNNAIRLELVWQDPENLVVSSWSRWNSWFTGKSLINVLLNSALSVISTGFNSRFADPSESSPGLGSVSTASELSVLIVVNLGVLLRVSTKNNKLEVDKK